MKKKMLAIGIMVLFIATIFVPIGIGASIKTVNDKDAEQLVNDPDENSGELRFRWIWGNLNDCSIEDYNKIIQFENLAYPDENNDYNVIWKDLEFEGKADDLSFYWFHYYNSYDDIHLTSHKTYNIKAQSFIGYIDHEEGTDNYFFKGLGFDIVYNIVD